MRPTFFRLNRIIHVRIALVLLLASLLAPVNSAEAQEPDFDVIPQLTAELDAAGQFDPELIERILAESRQNFSPFSSGQLKLFLDPFLPPPGQFYVLHGPINDRIELVATDGDWIFQLCDYQSTSDNSRAVFTTDIPDYPSDNCQLHDKSRDRYYSYLVPDGSETPVFSSVDFETVERISVGYLGFFIVTNRSYPARDLMPNGERFAHALRSLFAGNPGRFDDDYIEVLEAEEICSCKDMNDAERLRALAQEEIECVSIDEFGVCPGTKGYSSAEYELRTEFPSDSTRSFDPNSQSYAATREELSPGRIENINWCNIDPGFPCTSARLLWLGDAPEFEFFQRLANGLNLRGYPDIGEVISAGRDYFQELAKRRVAWNQRSADLGNGYEGVVSEMQNLLDGIREGEFTVVAIPIRAVLEGLDLKGFSVVQYIRSDSNIRPRTSPFLRQVYMYVNQTEAAESSELAEYFTYLNEGSILRSSDDTFNLVEGVGVPGDLATDVVWYFRGLD